MEELDYLKVSNIDIFSNPTNTINDSRVNADGTFVTNAAGNKRTDYLDISLANSILIEGNSNTYTLIVFYDEENNFVGNINIIGQGNGTYLRDDFPENAFYMIKNLQINGGDDVSDIISIKQNIDVFSLLKDLRSSSKYLEKNTVKKTGGRELYTGLDEITGSIVTLPYGTVMANSGGGYSGKISVKGTKKITFSGFPPGLNIKFFYNEDDEFLGYSEVNNGEIESKDYPSNGASYIMFTTRTSTITPTGNELVSAIVNEVVVEIGNEYTKPNQVYLKDYTPIYVPVGRQGEDILADGTVRPNITGNAWTGYLRLIQGRDIKIEGVPVGFNAKAFYNEEKLPIGTISINNGIILWENVPNGAIYIGMNIKNPALGDGTYSTKVFSFQDDLSDLSFGDDLIISMPPLIPVVVGVQMNLYLDNMRSNPVNDMTDFFIHEGNPITGTASNPYAYRVVRTERALQYMPTVSGQTVNLSARLRNRDYNILSERSFSLVSVSDQSGNGVRKVCILAGDSQIDPTYDGAKTSFAPFLKNLFVESGTVDMVFVGNEPMTETIWSENPLDNKTITCPTEGYGGRQINWFYESTSPFWNDAVNDVDMVNYIDNMKDLPGNPMGLLPGDGLDYFIFPMGVNDFNAGISTADIILRMKTMQQKVWNGYPNCVFVIGLVTQGSKYWSMDVRRKWNIEYYGALINEFTKQEYQGKVFISAAGLWTDNIFGSRQIRPYIEPYKRIVDSKAILINKLIQTQGLTLQQATDKVNLEYGLLVQERTLIKWMDEYPNTNDIVHSSWVSAMQQADCYYSTIKYLLNQ